MNRNYKIWNGSVLEEEGEYSVSWETVRDERNRALRKTDWRAVKDRTMSQAWKDYRTALRDLPQVHDEANDAADAWPEAPEDA